MVNLGDLFAILVLITAIVNAASPFIRFAIRLYSIQSLCLALFAFNMAFAEGALHLYLAAGVTLLIKGILIPYFLLKTYKRVGIEKEIELSIGYPMAVLLSGILTVLAKVFTLKFGDIEYLAGNSVFTISLATFFVGVLLLITRKKLLSQIISILIMENAIFLAASSVTQGMPLVVELGVLFDLLMTIMISSLLMLQIKKNYSDISSDKLKDIKE